MTFKLRTTVGIAAAVAVSAAVVITVTSTGSDASPRRGGLMAALAATEWRTIDGRSNNPFNRSWGQANTPYARVAPANYADGRGAMVQGPSERYISNRVFNDIGQNIFSENDGSQWIWVWGQFLDHDLGLKDPGQGENAPMAFSTTDPLERFKNDLGAMGFSRTPAAPGTGTSTRNPRQELNTITSFIDASNVYGSDAKRQDWIRAGALDGDPTNNSALLMLPDGGLPRADARGNQATAPPMDRDGQLMAQPAQARIAGDARANENIGLTATQTLFAREHNRIVKLLPANLPEQEKFQIARRVVGAEVQYITYTEFLPSVGVQLPRYRGWNPRVNPSESNEFATVGYRAHSQVHGEFEIDFEDGDFTAEQLAAFNKQGIKIMNEADDHALVVPLDVAFFNPDLVQAIGLDKVLGALSEERQYRNDEQIDETMRSVLFQIPKPTAGDPSVCNTPKISPDCFSGVQDLGALDIARGRDHGMPTYNQMRRAYGLRPLRTFTQVTGEATEEFPAGDAKIAAADPIDDPNIMDYTELKDRDGNELEVGSDEAVENATVGVRRTTLAARLKAIYGTVDKMDAFVGMSAEAHIRGGEFGELQRAIWARQFANTRDGDRFFYQRDPALRMINAAFNVDFRHSLADVINLNTGQTVRPDVFRVMFPAAMAAPAHPTSPHRTGIRIVPDVVESHRVLGGRH
jgi:peroxidase